MPSPACDLPHGERTNFWQSHFCGAGIYILACFVPSTPYMFLQYLQHAPPGQLMDKRESRRLSRGLALASPSDYQCRTRVWDLREIPLFHQTQPRPLRLVVDAPTMGHTHGVSLLIAFSPIPGYEQTTPERHLHGFAQGFLPLAQA